MIAWTDAHNHLQDARLGDADDVIAAMTRSGVGHAIVNATRESDWSSVEKISTDNPGFVFPAFGVHPWQALGVSEGWLGRLAMILEQYPDASVGECGLDQWVSEPSIEIQRPVFMAQLRLAREMNRTITIHCLKAWGAFFDVFAVAPPPPRFLMHSFGGSIETARRLIPMGAYFSFSGYFLHPRKSSVLDVFRKLPRDRILLETDAPDMLPPASVISHPMKDDHNHPANLPGIGNALAAALAMRPEELARITRDNTARCFGF